MLRHADLALRGAGIRVQACSTTFKGKLMFAQVTNPPPELLQQFGALCSHHSAGLLVCLFALFRW
jgi:hypothetical protein